MSTTTRLAIGIVILSALGRSSSAQREGGVSQGQDSQAAEQPSLTPSSPPGFAGLYDTLRSSVTPSGAFATRIGVKVPSFRGLEPEVTLAYSSQGSNGLLGAGWTMSVPRTIRAMSPGLGAPAYNSTDIYVLDGERLLPCGEDSPSPSCRYPIPPPAVAFYPEVETYQRVAYYQQADAWLVWDRSGVRYEFQRQVRTRHGHTNRWLLTRVADPRGNVVDFEYQPYCDGWMVRRMLDRPSVAAEADEPQPGNDPELTPPPIPVPPSGREEWQDSAMRLDRVSPGTGFLTNASDLSSGDELVLDVRTEPRIRVKATVTALYTDGASVVLDPPSEELYGNAGFATLHGHLCDPPDDMEIESFASYQGDCSNSTPWFEGTTARILPLVDALPGDAISPTTTGGTSATGGSTGGAGGTGGSAGGTGGSAGGTAGGPGGTGGSAGGPGGAAGGGWSGTGGGFGMDAPPGEDEWTWRDGAPSECTICQVDHGQAFSPGPFWGAPPQPTPQGYEGVMGPEPSGCREDENGFIIEDGLLVDPGPQAFTGSWYLSSVAYNDNTVHFHYEPRPDAVTAGIGDDTIEVMGRRLRTIDVQTLDHGVTKRARAYLLAYAMSPDSQRSWLTTVTQYGSDALVSPSGAISNANDASHEPPIVVQPLPPGVLGTYAADGHDFPAPAIAGGNELAPAAVRYITDLPWPFQYLTHVDLDANGDGLMDHYIIYVNDLDVFDDPDQAYLSGPRSRPQNEWGYDLERFVHVMPFLAQPGGGFIRLAEYATDIPDYKGHGWFGGAHVLNRYTAGDVDGDGRDELLVLHYNYRHDCCEPRLVGTGSPPDDNGSHYSFAAVFLEGNSHLYTGGPLQDFGWDRFHPFEEWDPEANVGRPGKVHPKVWDSFLSTDLNGDGFSDLVLAMPFADGHPTDDRYIYTALSRGNGAFDVLPPFHASGSSGNPSWWLSGDVDGNGRNDLIFVEPGDVNGHIDHVICTARMRTGKLSALQAKPYDFSCRATGAPRWDGQFAQFSTGDFNGDGNADLLRVFSYDSNENDNCADCGLGGQPICGGDSDGFGRCHFREKVAFQLFLADGQGGFVTGPELRTPYLRYDPYLVLELHLAGRPYQRPGWLVGDIDGDGRADIRGVVDVWDLQLNQPFASPITLHALPGADPADVKLVVEEAPRQPFFSYTFDREERLRWDSGGGSAAWFSSTGGADADGDGRADLQDWSVLWSINTKTLIARATMDVSVQRSPATVTYDPQSQFFALNPNVGVAPEIYVPNLMPVPGPALQGAAVDAVRWRQADLNGDGLWDRVYTASVATQQGQRLHIEARLRRRNGGWTALPPFDAPWFAGEQRNDFRIGDVNGDGRSDLIYVRPGGLSIGIVTLLSNGDNSWRGPGVQEFQADWRYPMNDRHKWFLLDADGDAQLDLIYVGYPYAQGGCPSGRQLRVDTFLARGPNGESWARRWWQEDACEVPGQSAAWNVADVDGNGRGDLVGLWRDGTAALAASLIADGTGGWLYRVAWIDLGDVDPQGIFLGTPRVGDSNADGLSDLTVLTDDPPEPSNPDYHVLTNLSVYHFLSSGDGEWHFQADEEPWPGVALDLARWQAADVNGDSRVDLVHPMVRTGQLQVALLVQQAGASMRMIPFQQVRAAHGFAWEPEDVDGDGNADLELVTFDVGAGTMLEETAKVRANPDVVTGIRHGLGASTLVSYDRTAGREAASDPWLHFKGCWLPPGFARRTVSWVSTDDGRGVKANTQNGASCPVWLPGRRSYVFKKHVATESWAPNRSAQRRRHRYDVSEACRARLSSEIVDDLSRPLGWDSYVDTDVQTSFVPAGVAAPYHCETQAVSAREHDAALAVAGTLTRYVYDDMGMAAQVQQEGDFLNQGDELTTLRSYTIAPGPYIVTLARETVYQGLGVMGPRRRDTAFCYDGQNPDPNCGLAPATKGLPTAVLSWDDRKNQWYVTRDAYDPVGNVVAHTDANGETTTFQYDVDHRLYPTVVDPPILPPSFTDWNAVYEAINDVVDPNGVTLRSIEYDALGRVTASSTPDGGRVDVEYVAWGDPANQHVVERVADGSAEGLWTRTYQDGLGRAYRIERKGSPGVYAEDIGYSDTSGRPYWQTRAYDTLAGGPQAFVLTYYDFLGRQTMIQHADGAIAVTYYYAGKRVEYDEQFHRKDIELDAYGQLRTVAEMNDNPWGTYVTRYQYDPMGRLETITDDQNDLWTFEWDSLDHNVVATTPDSGTTTFDYDPAGRLVAATDARGVTVEHAYDALGRPTMRWNDANQHLVEWAYDEVGHGVALGRVTSVLDSASGCAAPLRGYDYDEMGRTVMETTCLDGRSDSVQVGYDLLGRIDQVTYPDGELVGYSYDQAGRLFSAGDVATGMAYAPDGSLVDITLGNGVRERYGYRPSRGWLDSIEVGNAAGVMFDASYHYAADGLLTFSDEHQLAAWDDPLTSSRDVTRSYGHDALHRLRDVIGQRTVTPRVGAPVQGAVSEAYEYDPIGNMTFNAGLGGYSYQPDAGKCQQDGICGGGPHAVKRAGDTWYGYDSAGNLVTSLDGATTRTFEWDELGNLARARLQTGAGIQETELVYDADNRRVKKVVAPGTPNAGTTYFPSRFFEITPQGQFIKYYFAGGRLLARQESSGARTYYHLDRTGSTRLLTNDQGEVVESYDYTAFGASTTGDGQEARGILFTGVRRDDDVPATGGTSGLDYLGARHNDPILGRLISADSVIPSLDSPQSLNAYSYAVNSPMAFADPTGHSPEDFDGAEGDGETGGEGGVEWHMGDNSRHYVIDTPEMINVKIPTPPPTPPEEPAPESEPQSFVISAQLGFVGLKWTYGANYKLGFSAEVGLLPPGGSIGFARETPVDDVYAVAETSVGAGPASAYASARAGVFTGIKRGVGVRLAKVLDAGIGGDSQWSLDSFRNTKLQGFFRSPGLAIGNGERAMVGAMRTDQPMRRYFSLGLSSKLAVGASFTADVPDYARPYYPFAR